MNTFTNTTHFYGSAHVSNQNYTDLDIKGSAHLTKVTVANSTDIKGAAHLINFTCPQLTVKGSMHAESIVVRQADIFGSFKCLNGQFDVLTVRGACAIQDSTISEKLSVHGGIEASALECPFIQVKTTRAEFKNSHIATIIVEKISDTYHGIFNLWGLLSWGSYTPKVTEIYLDGSSVDSVTFQGIPGRVILSHGARMGTVVNGTVENR